MSLNIFSYEIVQSQEDMDTRQTTSEEDDLETSSDGSSSQNSASNRTASVSAAAVIRQSDPDIVISKNVSSSGSAAGVASRNGDSHQILISSSSSINVRGEKAEERARSVLQKGAPPSGVASEVLLRPPPRLKKLAKMRQAEQMHRTRNDLKNFQPVFPS